MRIGTGPVAAPIYIGEVRELRRDDLTKLEARRETKPVLERIRDSHHQIARMLALGMRYNEVAERTGYSYSRIAILAGDPSMKELVAHYRKVVDESFTKSTDDYYKMLSSNALKAERMLADKLDDAEANSESLPVRELLAISRDSADRIGYGKKQMNLNVNVNEFAAKMEAAIRRSGKTIDHEFRTQATPRPAAPLVISQSPPTSDSEAPTIHDEAPIRRRVIS